MEKQTIKQLMDGHMPPWTYFALSLALNDLGIDISDSTISRHRNGAKPNKTFRTAYCKIFNKTEEEIDFSPLTKN